MSGAEQTVNSKAIMAPTKKAPVFIAITISLAVMAWFLLSRLSFVPVPWPDGSAFYLPSVEWLSWPPKWKMHSQAAFVPSYDAANFNMMPMVPSFLGIGVKLGLSKVFGIALAIRVVSLSVLIVWSWLLWILAGSCLKKMQWALLLGGVIALAGLMDPINRWGTMVVRSETWIGLSWLFILLLLKKRSEFTNAKEAKIKESHFLWLISAALAFAAYCHFEAVLLVPPVAVALWPWENAGESGKIKSWIKSLAAVGLCTCLFLLPWFVYVLSNFSLFTLQMETQFYRLASENTWIENAYSLFHSLFISLGSPVSWPKFFNLAKVVFWLLLFLLFGRLVFSSALRVFKKDSACGKEFGLNLAAGIAVLGSLYLWFTKPEVWFITLVHLMLWPWVALAANQYLKMPHHRVRHLLVLTAIYFFISLFATFAQQRNIPKSYSWSLYSSWIDCIQGAINKNNGKKIWQPHVPDVLVELSEREPTWDLTRALDFSAEGHRAWELTYKVDAIILSNHFASVASNDSINVYEGPERESDRELLGNGVEVPFGPWVRDRFPVEQPGVWSNYICHYGPFWADLTLRKLLLR